MQNSPLDPEFKSAERLEFEIYLRSGRRLARPEAPERKFNPYHDPRNGQFTFAPGGPRSVTDPIFSDWAGVWERNPRRAKAPGKRTPDGAPAPPVDEILQRILPTETAQAGFQLANGGGRGPRRSRGPGSPRPSDDPVLLEHAFPGLSRSPAGTIIRMADGIADLTTAAQEATRELHNAQVRRLVAEIRGVDPNYHFESLGEPDTIEARANQIKGLRFRRALAFFRKRNDFRPLQIEALKIMQQRADSAYEEAVKQYDAGRLIPRLSREEAIGNYVDAAVRADLRSVFNVNQLDISPGQPVRVVGREYNNSGTDRTYRIPDARVGDVAFDVTLTQKTLRTPQVRGFFSSDFRPSAVIIVRPRQLGGSYTYAIKRPGK